MYIRYCCGNKNLYVSQRFMILVKIMWIRKSKYNTFQIWEQGKSLYWASVNFSQSQHYLRKTTTIIFSYQLWLKIKWDGNRLYCEIFDSFRILETYNNIWCTWIGSGRFKSLQIMHIFCTEDYWLYILWLTDNISMKWMW